MIVIFDLDGTLLNTIDDLGEACNYALAQVGLPPIPMHQYPHLVGNGINKLLERAVVWLKSHEPVAMSSADREEVTVETLRHYFVPYYDTHNRVHTHPYEGIVSLLTTLKEQGAYLAVASNKYQAATEQIVHHFFPNIFDVVLGEREGVPRKPDPQIVADILTVCNDGRSNSISDPTSNSLSDLTAQRSIIYVGDSLVDIETARNAQAQYNLPITMIACAWGFVEQEQLEAAKPDRIVQQPNEIAIYLKK